MVGATLRHDRPKTWRLPRCAAFARQGRAGRPGSGALPGRAAVHHIGHVSRNLEDQMDKFYLGISTGPRAGYSPDRVDGLWYGRSANCWSKADGERKVIFELYRQQGGKAAEQRRKPATTHSADAPARLAGVVRRRRKKKGLNQGGSAPEDVHGRCGSNREHAVWGGGRREGKLQVWRRTRPTPRTRPSIATLHDEV